MPQKKTLIPTHSLGQTGFRFEFDQIIVYIDPYLSNSVEEHEGKDLRRSLPIPVSPDQVRDADYVLVTHEHRDHCDDQTLLPISRSSPQACFVGPPPVAEALSRQGIQASRIIEVREKPVKLTADLEVIGIPSAHPEIEPVSGGGWRAIGFVIKWRERRLYHAGDTSVSALTLRHLAQAGPIDCALLPVNEANFFRNSRGIIGNMTVREAFQLAGEIGVDQLVPTHWDMFEINSVFPEEIELLYSLLKPKFRLNLRPTVI